MNRKHIFFYTLVRPLVIAFAKLRFGYQYEVASNLPDNYIVLSNHTTDYDLLFVASSFKRHMYFVGSEHIARWGFLYTLLKFAFAPIMRPKGTSAAHTVKEMMRAVKGGANVCLFAEGVRSWDGSPSPIAPSTAKMVRRMGCGLVTYRIKGGYFVSPMWGGASVRRGWLHGGVANVYTKEQLAEMTNEEVYAAICTDLGEDAYQRQLAEPKKYSSKSGAEGLETLLFLCPHCGARDTFRSHGDTVECTQCELSFRYNEYGMLEGAPYDTLKDFSDWQKTRVPEDLAAGVAYTAPHAVLKTLAHHEETPLSEGPLSMDTEFLCCGDVEIPMAEISDLAMHGQHSLVFTAGSTYYDLRPADESNALKFFLYYQAYKQFVKAETV